MNMSHNKDSKKSPLTVWSDKVTREAEERRVTNEMLHAIIRAKGKRLIDDASGGVRVTDST